MKKMCIYVEGQTEQIFLEKLLLEIAGKNNIALESYSLHGGGKNSTIPKRILILKTASITVETKYYVQIISCNNDERVNSEIKENCLNMQEKGFSKVLGLRDLFPKKLEELEKIKKYSIFTPEGLNIIAKTIIAIFEVETWFLAEYTSLEKIDSRLNYEFIKSIGYDLKEDNLEQDTKYSPSAKVLDEILHKVNQRYDKTHNKVEKIVKNIDYDSFYVLIRKKLSSLNEFLVEIDEFFKD